MLQDLRDNSRGVISFILIGFLVIIFALTGVDALFNWDASGNKAASVNGEKVTEMEVARAISMQKQQMINRYGDQVPAEFLTDDYLRKPVLENLIQRRVLSQAAHDFGMRISDTFLSEQIATSSQFKNEQGVFDNTRYQQALRNMGFTHSTYTKLLGDELVINQLQAGISNTAFTTSTQLEDVIALSFQTRDLRYAVIPAEKVRESVTVDDAEVQAHYDANPQMFTSQEQVAVDYIDLNVDDLMKGITITEEQVRQQYEQSLAAFVASPERQAAHILIEGDNPDKVKAVTDKLAAGEDFIKIVEEYSDDLGSKDQGGDLGFSKGDAFPEEFEAALAKLKVGEVSPAVKTDAGIHFIKLLAEKGSQAPTFEDQRATIEAQLKRAEAENLFVTQLEKLKELAFNADNLNDVAKELGVNAQNSGLFDRSSGKDLTADTKFIEAAFSAEVLQEGNSSDVIELDTTRVVVLKKTDHKPSQLRPLADVKEQIVNLLKDQKARTLLTEKGNAMVASLNAGTAFDEAAKTAGVEVKEAKAIARSNTEVDSDIIRYAFSLAKPQSGKANVGGVMTLKGDFAVVSLDAVTPGNDKVTPEQKTAIVAQLASIYGENDFNSYQKFLKDSADIEQE